MHSYSVQEDCQILLAALNVGVHRKHGKFGGISKRSEHFTEVYRRLCRSKGFQCRRSEGSLKMRLYRLFCAGIMKWGPPREKANLCLNNRSEIDNFGTKKEKADRENLLWQLFTLPNGKYCLAKKWRLRKRAPYQSRRKQAAVGQYSPEQEKPVTNTISKQVHEQYPIATPRDTLDLRLDNIQRVRMNEGHFVIPPPIATPEERLVQQTGVDFERHVLQAPRTFSTPRSGGDLSQACALLSGDVIAEARSRDRKTALLQSAYKENLKAFRELTAMQDDMLNFMRIEYEKHRLFLNKRLDDMAEQQEQLLELMKTVIDTKQE